ncbi:3-hydroxyacyl-CoA dehydrogenase/enoyl-CoA hydratase family protein [Kamptonema cortianum]|nr:3-hydroxyacyl-CoA dehydrogenase/enoyl-CoA hydratase family protein [Kamptonema cortianum]
MVANSRTWAQVLFDLGSSDALRSAWVSSRSRMLENCRNVCVIGAGTMGSGIAAHLANLGFEVTLLDLTMESAQQAFERAKAARPPHFYLPRTAETIRLGSVQDNLDWAGEAGWVCEAVVEKMDVKRALYERLEPILRPDALISTNTSGLQIGLLHEGRGDSFRKRFIGTHFFNPPRYLKLLELIPTEETDPAVIADTIRFLEESVARRVVLAKDTPGFIANRYGMWCMFHAIHTTEKLGLTIEEVDEITGPFLGRPRSGSFRLNDIVGLDIMQDIADNLRARCVDDPDTHRLSTPKSMAHLSEKGWIGGKAGQGYYKKEGNQFVSFDLKTYAYRGRLEPELPTIQELGRMPLSQRLPEALQRRDEVGEFLREYLVPALHYAFSIREEIAYNVRDFDRVMQWGFGWEASPFEMIDMIGAPKLGIETKTFYASGQVLGHDGNYFAPPAEPEYRALSDFPLLETRSGFNVRELGDGVIGIGFTNKMGVVDPAMVSDLSEFLTVNPPERMVISSEAKAFSAGFDLKFFSSAIDAEDFDSIDRAIEEFQKLNDIIRKIPSVAALFGFCLGGGFEIALGCTRIAAAAESQIGLPEPRVGLIPGGAGTPMMRLRSQAGGAKGMLEMIKVLSTATLSANADHARHLGFLRDEDVTVYHADRLITDAKALVLTLSTEERPRWQEVAGPFSGMVDRMQVELKAKGDFSNHDELISDHMKHVFAKSDSYEDALIREREAFVSLCREGLSNARIKHMIQHGKPLRN